MFIGGVAEEPGDGNYPAGGQGPLNSTFGPANIPCLAAMYPGPPQGPPGVHVHAFVGIFFGGKEIALPDGIGIADPSADGMFNGIPNWTQYAYGPSCFYQMHTHDASGTIHIESYTAPPGGYKGTLYTLGDFIGLWGVPFSSTQLGPFSGNITAYTSGQIARGGPGTNGLIKSTLYTQWMGDPSTIPLYSHEVIWLVIGNGNPTGTALPNVSFGIEY